jgi:hypothetical protein
MLRIGVIVGREWSWPPAFIDEVNRREEGVLAEFARLGGTRMDDPCPYAVIVDRISHEVPYYRSYLKYAMLQGAYVINNPFMWTADDKFFEAALATKLGIASPKSVVLPNKDYVEGIVSESLRNLVYPLPWEDIAAYVGLPAILKDAHGGGWKEVYRVNSLGELFAHFDHSGRLTMVLQEFIQWDAYVRCMALGQEEVLVMKYDPHNRRYLVNDLDPSLNGRIVRDTLTLVRALGYDMDTLEWAVRGGVPYAIDFMNPAPDMDINSLGPEYFQWCLTRMADLCIRLAKERRPQGQEMRWSRWFGGGPVSVTDSPSLETVTARGASV